MQESRGHLLRILQDSGSLLVGYSGGVDSVFLAAIVMAFGFAATPTVFSVGFTFKAIAMLMRADSMPVFMLVGFVVRVAGFAVVVHTLKDGIVPQFLQ